MSSTRIAEGRLEITVTEPQLHDKGRLQSHVSYKVSTITDLPHFDQRQFFQVRRYSDFVWLHEQLVRGYPGVIIPPIPEKQIVGTFDEEFVESRRRALEKFLNRVAAHPSLRSNSSFKAFLEEVSESFARTKENSKLDSASNTGFWTWATGLSSAAPAFVANVPFAVAIPSTEPRTALTTTGGDHQPSSEDIAIQEASRYIDGFEQQIVNVHKHALGLMNRNREMVKCLLEFGMAFTSLSQSEEENLKSALSHFGECGDNHSKFASEVADKEVRRFEEPIRDYVRLCGAVRHALEVQMLRKTAYEQARSDLAAKKAAHQNLLAKGDQSESTNGKLAQIEAEVNQAQAKADAQRRDYETVTRIVLDEVERFKREKLTDFKAIVTDFVQAQIDYNADVEKAWRAVLPELEKLAAAADATGTDESSGNAAAVSGGVGSGATSL